MGNRLKFEIKMLDSVGWRKVGNTVVLVDMARREYCSLEGLAAQMWESFSNGKAPAEVLEDVLDRCNVEPDVAEKDLLEFVTALKKKNLIDVASL